jgi:hypothetical protein
MEFEFWMKESDSYKKCVLTPPSGSGWSYLKTIKMTIDKELDNIKSDILENIDVLNTKYDLSFPKSKDEDKQKKINTLIDIRTTNIRTKNQVITLLAAQEFIICSECNSKMFKKPVNESYEKVGDQYVLKNASLNVPIRYVFMCEQCINAISEEVYENTQTLKKTREELLKKGETFVPNEFNFWHDIHVYTKQ